MRGVLAGGFLAGAAVVSLAACSSSPPMVGSLNDAGSSKPRTPPADASLHDATNPPTGSGDAGPVDVTADAAPPPPSCDLPDAGAGCGWLCGDGVSATICDVTGKVYTRDSILAGEGVGPATLLELGGEGVISFRKPAVASDGSLIGYVAVNAAPGVYSSGEAIGCSDFSVSYYLPVPASVDCGDASGPSCPAGCTSACSGFGCLPCTPNPPGILYAAQTVDPLCNGPSNESPTDGGERAGIGSWTATLTAVDPAGSSAGATAYTAHGTLRAELVGEGPDGGAIGSATLLLVF